MAEKSDGAPTGVARRAITVAILGLLALSSILALILLLLPAQRVAATNNAAVVDFTLKNHTPQQGEVCVVGQYVPSTTSGVRMVLGTYGAEGVVRVRILDGERVVSRGESAVSASKERVTVPVRPLERTLHNGRLCIASDTKLAIAGHPDGGKPNGELYVGGKNIGSTIHVDYMHKGRQSLAQMLPTVFARASLWAPGWVGGWTFWIFLFLLPAVAAFGCLRLMRLLRGELDPSGIAWLGLALAIATVNMLAWTVFSPQLMGPDEVSHYAYTETLVNQHKTPSRTIGVGGYGSYGNHEILAVDSAILGILGVRDARMPWSRASYERWRARDAALPDLGAAQGGSWTPAAGYSPLYYLGSVVPYEVASGTTIWTQAWVMRLWSLLLTLGTVAFCFFFARELIPGVSWAAPVAGLAAAFQPMLMHVGSLINNDSLLILVASATLYVLARIVRRGLTLKTSLVGGVLLGLGILAKPTFLGLVPVVAFVYVHAWLSARDNQMIDGRGRRFLTAVAGLVAALVVLAPYYLMNSARDSGLTGTRDVFIESDSSPGGLLSYLWQWYLPKLPGMNPAPTSEGIPVFMVYARGYFAQFNSLDTYFATRWYMPLFALLLALIGGACAWGWRERARIKAWWPGAVLCVLATVSMMLMVNLRSWMQLLYDGTPFAQGRYLLPLIAISSAGIAAGAQGFRRFAPAIAGLAVSLLAVMNLFGYATSLTRFFL